MDAEDFDLLLNRLKCQYLCGYPNSIHWMAIPADITWEQQAALVANTYKHPLNQKYPVKVSYQVNFFKRLIELFENLDVDVHDAIYESYCSLQQQASEDVTQKYAFKHYVLTAYDIQLTLRESKCFVAQGTTGLCSWQASLALADFLLYNPQFVQEKRVLELGAGTGLCGFVLAKCCKPEMLQLSDGSVQCLQLMEENIARNFKDDSKSKLKVLHLPWAEIATVNPMQPDILIAADVVYDDCVFDELVNAIDYVFTQGENKLQMLLAATERNKFTLKKFLELLASKLFSYEQQPVISEQQSHLHWDRSTPVNIYLITRN